jgi:hypothetical protein
MRTATAPRGKTVVWIAPGADEFSCLCEPCLERGRAAGASLLDLLRDANVRGSLALVADVGFVRCSLGHQLIVRRASRAWSGARDRDRKPQLASVPR